MFKSKGREDLYNALTQAHVNHLPGLIAVEAIPNQSAALAAFIAEWAIQVRGMPRAIGSRTWRGRSERQANLWNAMTDADRNCFNEAYKRGMGL